MAFALNRMLPRYHLCQPRNFSGSEPCPDWLEERIDLPIYEDLTPSPEPELYDCYSSPEKPSQMHLISLPLPDLLGDLKPYVCSPPPDTKAGVLKFDPGQSNFQDFTTPVWTPPLVPKVDALTPPDSPKDDDDLLTSMLDGIEPELCNELEELVRMHAENLVDDYKTPPSAESNVECSATESHEDDSSDSNHSVCASSPCFSSDSGSGSCSEDPEWVPDSYTIPPAPQQKKRRIAKPYNRPAPEDKKLRKKEQNKNAATRYRLKKKAEIEEILVEEQELQDKNDQLHNQVVELAREIKYLKSLMRDVFKASGLIK